MGFLDPHEHLDAVIANGGDDTLVVLFNYGTGSGTFDSPRRDPARDELDGLLSRRRSAWGNKGGPADLDGNGAVDFDDLLIVLAA